MTYYNENNPYAAAWLRNLIAAQLIPGGAVDERSIADVLPEELFGYTQQHFFAGLGGWAYALRLAGWPDDRSIWTGSCPCQPFSLAGKQRGFADERHLWPEWLRLIAVCRPPVIFGEQVASAAQWITRVRSDLEALDYAVGAIPIQAASAGAAQLRDRFWLVARNDGERGRRRPDIAERGSEGRTLTAGTGACDVAGSDFQRPSDGSVQRSGQLSGAGCTEEDRSGDVAREFCKGLEGFAGQPGDSRPERAPIERSGPVGLVSPAGNGWGEGWTESEFRGRGFTAAVASLPDGTQFIECPDGKYRRLPPPRVRWLGHGIPARVSKLRALGNSIYPPLAAEVIRAYMETYA